MSRYSSKRSISSRIKRTIKRPVKKAFAVLSTKSGIVKKVYMNTRRKKREQRYERYTCLPVDDKLVLFESFMGRKYADSPKAIYEYMLNNPDYSDYKFIWFFKDRCMDEYLFLEKNERTALQLWGSPDYYKSYAQAKYWFTNSRVPAAITPREEQVYVQCWHGTPLKRLGFDIEVEAKDARNDASTVREVYENDARRYTYMISPSKYCSEKFASAFNLNNIGKSDIMIEEGYPRNDAIVNHSSDDINRIKRELGISEDKKVILYAPTWRENQHNVNVGYVYESPIEFDGFREKLGDEYVILFRVHYFIANAFDFEENKGFVYDVSDYPEINDLYIISDVLITDYSSVFFDFGILKRPEIFFMYDLKYYKDELRGFYLTLDELPGPIVETQEELEKKLQTIDEWTETEEYLHKYDNFTGKFTYLDDGHATERVVKAIIK